MNRTAHRMTLLLAFSTLTLALGAGAAPAAAAAAAGTPVAAPSAPAAKKVSLEFHGPLREALKKIASEGGINLVVTGELNENAEVYFSGAPADEALSSVATAYHLHLTHKGSVWALRPMTDDERESAEDGASEAAEHDTSEHAEAAEAAAEASVAAEASDAEAEDLPVPPLPPNPMLSNDIRDEIRDRLRDRVRNTLHKAGRGRHGNDLVGTQSVTVSEGQTVGDVVSYGGGVTVNGHVEGDAVAFGGGVTLGDQAVVEGDVVAFGGPVHRADSAQIGGEVISLGGPGMGKVIAESMKQVRHHDHQDGEDEDEVSDNHPGDGVPGFLVSFATLFGVGFLATLFAPTRMKQLSSELTRDPLKCGVAGLVGSIALLPIGFLTALICIFVVTIPFVIAFWVMVGLGILMGFSAVASEIGTRLPLNQVKKTQALVLAVGLLIVLLVGRIPVLGPVTLSAVAILSLGTVIRTRFGSTKRQGIPEPV